MAEANPTTVSTSVEYRDIPEFPGYRVGSDGTVWSSRMRGWRRLKPTPNHKGYLMVTLRAAGTGLHRFVHVLVLTAFVGPRPEGHESAHGSGGKTDNSVGNLRWATPQENHQDRESMGTVLRGEDHPNTSLTAEQVGVIRGLIAGGMRQKDVARRFGVSRRSIWDIIHNRRWTNQE